MKSTKCLACGFVGWSDLEYCKACGAAFGQHAAYAGQASPGYSAGYESLGQKKGLAIASLVLGVISFFTLGLLGVGAIIGIVLAVMAMSKVKNEPWTYGGRGIAIAGLVLSITSLLAAVPIGIIAAIAIPNLLQARMAANEGSAIHSLRVISAAEATYQAQFQRYGTLEELAAASLIDPKLASGTKNGYRFTIKLTEEGVAVEPVAENSTGFSGLETDSEAFSTSSGGFQVSGVPVDYRSSGRRSFYVDETGIIRAADNVGMPSSGMDPPLQATPRLSSRRDGDL
jgi:type II secretory pathway pseudopilin PulG